MLYWLTHMHYRLMLKGGELISRLPASWKHRSFRLIMWANRFSCELPALPDHLHLGMDGVVRAKTQERRRECQERRRECQERIRELEEVVEPKAKRRRR